MQQKSGQTARMWGIVCSLLVVALLGWSAAAIANTEPWCMMPGETYESMATGERVSVWIGRDDRLFIFGCPRQEEIEENFGASRRVLVEHHIQGLGMIENGCTFSIAEYGDIHLPYWEISLISVNNSVINRHTFTVQPVSRKRLAHEDELSTAFVDNVPCRALPPRSNRPLPESHKY